MKSKLIFICSLFLLMTSSIFSADNSDSAKVAETNKENIQQSEQVVISYLHMNRRCSTCKKLEAYSEEAIMKGFAKELEDSTLIWQSINFEEEGNEHFAKTYKLYSQSLVVSRLKNGKETEWKNLDKIWGLASKKDDFIAYVQKSVKEFIKPSTTK